MVTTATRVGSKNQSYDLAVPTSRIIIGCSFPLGVRQSDASDGLGFSPSIRLAVQLIPHANFLLASGQHTIGPLPAFASRRE